MKPYLYLLAFALVACHNSSEEKESVKEELTNYVNPFIGTDGTGNTYPGAMTPFGMVQLSPDIGIPGWDRISGYFYPDSIITGFSHTHLSGTGAGDLYDVLIMPTNSRFNQRIEANNRLPFSYFSHQHETATAGYYSVDLLSYGIKAELTATPRVGVQRYTFPKDEQSKITVDLGYSINWDKPIETYLKVVDNTTLEGYRFSTGWARNQKVYFVIKLSKPFLDKEFTEEKENGKANRSKMVLRYATADNETIVVKTALSMHSIAGAYKNMEAEAPHFAFDDYREAARNLWERQLQRITVEGGTEEQKTIFYTMLYQSMLAPNLFSDADAPEKRYDTFSLWDTFRAEHPLLTLLQPKVTADIINSMLAYYQVHKVLPVWTLYGNETNTMTGYHSVAVIAEAYLKGIRGFDAEKAYEAMKTTMMQDDRGLKAYKKYGYIPYNAGVDESVTITLEYAYDDWCVAQMAKALGKTEDADFFTKRSEAYAHLFDKETGFMRGKSTDGKWRTPFDPKRSDHRENTDYTEGNAWQHSWFVPHNVQGLINLFGGNEPFVTHLEKLFTESSEITGDNTSPDISGLIGQYAHGNEPSHHIAYMFNVAGQPKKTQYWVDRILQTQYNTTPNGLSGNEDCGQMSAWYIWSAMGLYPMNPASTEYQFGRPLFDKVTIHLPNGKTFTIIAKNVSKDNKYIQSVKLNGKEYSQWHISHQDLLKGGELVFEMTNK